MKVIFLYGPPAVGKLAIGEKLAAVTGLPLFHNHVATNFASSIMFPHGWKRYDALASQIRLAVVRSMLAARTRGLIMTYAFGLETYRGKDDLKFVRDLRSLLRENDGKIFFLKLEASLECLSQRVNSRGRRRLNKLTDPRVLGEIMRRRSLAELIPDVESLVLNTEQTLPDDAVRIVLKHCGMRRRPKVKLLKHAQAARHRTFDYLID